MCLHRSFELAKGSLSPANEILLFETVKEPLNEPFENDPASLAKFQISFPFELYPAKKFASRICLFLNYAYV